MKAKFILIVVSIITLLFFGRHVYIQKKYSDYAKVKILNKTFWVEIADTPSKHKIGLANKDKIRRKEGMIFIFDYPQRSVYSMKNVNTSLDILWIDPNGKIVKIKKSAPPCTENLEVCPTYAYQYNIDTVIKIKGGWAEKLELEVGDFVEIELPN